MPSPKAPGIAVQPGPGNLPDETVSASALDFNPMGGSGAALQAHITNPTDAHVDSAISTDGFGGTGHWSAPAGSVESTLDIVFSGLNARGIIVCDANPTATDADYAGIAALSSAYSSLPANNKSIIYLRPGVYSWSDVSVFGSVTIIGGGSPDTNVAATQVEIQASNVRIGAGAIVKNLILTTSGSVQFPSGGCLLDNVAFKTTGSNTVASTKNVFRQCGTHVSSTVPTMWTCSGGNTYETFNVEQLSVLGIGSSFTNVAIGGNGIAPPFPAAPMVSITSANSVFNRLTISQSGPALTGRILEIGGSLNALTDVQIQGTNTSAGTVAFSGGTSNTITGLRVTGATCGGHVIRFIGSSDNTLRNAVVASSTIALGENVVDFQDNRNSVEGLSVSGLSGGPSSVVLFNGSRNKVVGLSALSSSQNPLVFFAPGTSNNELRQLSYQSTNNTCTTAVIHVQGSNNLATGIELNGITALAVPIVKFTSATSSEVANIRLTGIAATAGAGFSLVSYAGSANCNARSIDLTSSGNMATTSGLVVFSNSVGCGLDGLRVNTVGASAAVNSPILTGTGPANVDCVIRNVYSAATSYAPNTVLMDVDQSAWEGLLIERVILPEQPNGSTALKLRQSGAASQSVGRPITIQDCTFTNVSTASNHAVWVDAFGGRVVIQRCVISAGGSGAASLKVDGSWNVSITDCTLVAGGPSALAASATNSGARFTRCTFLGPGSGSSGTQLFNGWGFAGNTTFPHAPLVLQDCSMQLNTRNNAPTATTVPNVIFGGSGSTAAVNHGATIVNGLTIGKAPGVTFTSWHRSPTLAIDVLNQVAGVQSFFENITLDLENIPFNGPGSNTSVFNPVSYLTSLGVVVEINGPASGDPRSRINVVKGLSLLRLPRSGGGARCALLAKGVGIENLTVDAAAGAATSWNGSAVGISNCSLTGADFYPTTSLPLGTNIFNAHLFAEASSKCDRIFMHNFAIASAEQDMCVHLRDSSLSNSSIHMQAGSHLPMSDGSIILAVSGNTDSDVWITNNKITYVHYATSSADVRRVILCSGTGVKILNNTFRNLATASAGGYSGTPASSNGGGCLINNSLGNNMICSGNTLNYEWETNLDIIPAISSTGERCRILGNIIHNSASTAHGTQGGSVRVEVVGGGLYNNVSNNMLLGSNAGGRVLIDTTGSGSSIVMGNQVDNIAGVGVINVNASDKPTPIASFNFLT